MVLLQVHARPGRFQGGTLHGGGTNPGSSNAGRSGGPGNGGPFFFARDGGSHNGLVTVLWELEDTRCNGGGFCCIQSSHKSTVEFAPQDARNLAGSDPRNAKEGVETDIRCIEADPGDCIIFVRAD